MNAERKYRRIYQATHADMFVEKFKRISLTTIRAVAQAHYTNKKEANFIAQMCTGVYLYV